MQIQEFPGPASGVPFYGVPQLPYLATQQVNLSDNASVVSEAFSAGTGLIRIDPSGEVAFVQVGDDDTVEATGASVRVDVPTLFLVAPGQFLAAWKNGPL